MGRLRRLLWNESRVLLVGDQQSLLFFLTEWYSTVDIPVANACVVLRQTRPKTPSDLRSDVHHALNQSPYVAVCLRGFTFHEDTLPQGPAMLVSEDFGAMLVRRLRPVLCSSYLITDIALGTKTIGGSEKTCFGVYAKLTVWELSMLPVWGKRSMPSTRA